MFLFKKYITPLFLPLSLIMIIMAIGLFLLFFSRRQKTGKIIITTGVLLLFSLSYGPVPDILLKTLENRYSTFDTETKTGSNSSLKWVVVLGGGHVSNPTIPSNDQLSTTSLARLVEGIRIHKKIPGSQMILSGGTVFDFEPESKAMANTAQLLNVAPQDIMLENTARDTEEQAENIKAIVRKDRFVLVTSAYHMPRSIALFKRYGLNPVAAPTDHMLKGKRHFNPIDIYPSAGGLQKTTIVMHEYLGLVWIWLKQSSNMK